MIDRRHGLLNAIVLASTATALIACDTDSGGSPYVIPGPAGPSPIPTRTPYVWDSRDELDVWIGNQVSRGSVSTSGEGPSAVIRIETGGASSTAQDGSRVAWLLRGPDFATPVVGVRAVRIQYTWTPAPRNTSVPIAIPDIYAVFQVPDRPAHSSQTTLRSDIVRDNSGEMVLADRYPTPFEANYFYLILGWRKSWCAGDRFDRARA